jgi:ABC-type dipeptide/oligopeptide/nickel transport system permease component
MTNSHQELLQRGIVAARTGQISEARRLIAKSIQIEPHSERAWLSLSTVAKDNEELARILLEVLKINPHNPYAARRLRVLGKLPPVLSMPTPTTPEVEPHDTARQLERTPDQVRIETSRREVSTTVKTTIRGKLRAKDIFGFAIKFGERLGAALLLLLGLIFLVSIAMALTQGGGLSSFREAIPSAIESSYKLTNDLLQGDIESLEKMRRLLPNSLGLLILSLSVGVTVGLLLGTLAALRRHSRLSGWLISFSVLGMSTPSYVAAMFLIWSFLGINKATGVRLLPTFGFGWDFHLVMPTLVLATRPMANMTRLSYSALIDIFEADFVRTAHSKGLHSRLVFWRHVLRNAGVPLLTTAGVTFRFSLAMLPVVEFIFSWPGIGLALLKAIQSRDAPQVIVMVLPLAILFVIVNLLLDYVYQVIDPRLRSGEGGAA